jgi:membrane-associated phospholipid phosphatase
MPGGSETGSPSTLVESIVPLLHADFGGPFLTVAQAVTLPAQAVVSCLLVAAACFALVRRGRLEAAMVWATAWVLATAIEVISKQLLTRPHLYRHDVHLVAFDSSWPSGHAVRAAVIAAALAAAWPRLRYPLAVWLVAVAALLETAGFHTPTDVIGGLLLATVLVAGGTALERSGALARRAATRGGATRSGPRATPGRS